MPIQAVIFDFGGVLCFHPTHEAFASAAKACGIPPENFEDLFWADRIGYDAGKIEPEDYWRGIGRRAGREFNGLLIAEMIRREVDLWSHYDQRLTAWIGQLRESGFRTGILSNMPRPLGARLWLENRLLKEFDHITLSYELKAVKPQARIYEHMIRGLGIEPEEGLFLDDKPKNVEGARAAGLRAEIFVSWESFLESVRPRYGLPEPASLRPAPQGVARPQ